MARRSGEAWTADLVPQASLTRLSSWLAARSLQRCYRWRPGLGVLGESVDLGRQPPSSDVGEGHGLENRPLASPQCDPDLLQRLRRALVTKMLWALAADAEQWTLDDPNDVGER